MKRILFFAATLFLADQIMKLYISGAMPAAVVVPAFLQIYPFKNVNNGWLGGVLRYESPVWLNVLSQALYCLFSLAGHRYFTFALRGRRKALDIFLTLSLAGAACGFFDTVIWGGTWDYICFFDSYIFDLKDFYLITATFTILVFLFSLIPAFKRQSKEEKFRTGFIRWVKNGFPPE